MTDLNMPAKFGPNEAIPLEETEIVNIDGQSVDIPVSVVFRLHPFPTVVIESEMLSDLARQEDSLEIVLRNGAQLKVRLGALYFNPGQRILIPVSQPVNVIDNGSPLKEVSFAILNFPQFYGQQDKMINDAEQWVRRIPYEKLELPDWSVSISGVSDIGEAAKTLKRSRGYGITYNGSVIRSNGTPFRAEDVEPLLEALRVFLSIARGAACSLAFVKGQNEKNQEAWVRWGAHHSEPWLDYHTAFPQVHSDILPDLFPEFWILFMDQKNKKGSTLRALDWYLQSNVSAPYIGTILTFAALEAFSFLLLKDEEDSNKKKSKRRSDRERIERALSNMQIPLDLPKSCESLRVLRDWDTGPQALVAIRNNLVHPQRDLGGVSNMDYWEAWHLGQWYFELMLLSNLNSELKGGGQESHIFVREMERRLLWLPSVGNQTGDEIDEKVGRAPMPGVFNLRDILELVNDGLNDETFTRQQLVFKNDESILHVFAKRRDQLQSLSEELFKELLGEIAAVANQLTPQPFGHLWDRFTVIGVGGRELNRQQFTLVIDNQMEFEAIEPPHAALAARGHLGKDSVATDAPVVADSQRGRINECHPCPLTKTHSQIETDGWQGGWN